MSQPVGQAPRSDARARAPPPFRFEGADARSSGRRRPPGPIYGVRCRPTAADRSSSGHAFGSPCAVPRRLPCGLVLHGLARGSDGARRSAPGRSPASPGLPPREVPGWGTLLPRARQFGPALRPGHPPWASPPKPAGGWAYPHDRQRSAGGPLAVPPPQLDLGGPPSIATKSGRGAEPDRSGRERNRGVRGEFATAVCCGEAQMV
jgi:hypothetical protein